MLEFLHVTQISNFCIILPNLNPDFKHVIFSCFDELPDLRYMIGKLEVSSFHLNFNRSKIPPIDPDISQTVHEYLV